MLQNLARTPGIRSYHEIVEVKTSFCMEFIDLTDSIQSIVHDSGIQDGIVSVQTKHTTTAILINENEPLLLKDMKSMLESLAPRTRKYLHDNFAIRTVNLTPDERQNGHSHCKALFLHASESVNVIEGELQLGTWQRIFLLELDHSRERKVSVMILGN